MGVHAERGVTPQVPRAIDNFARIHMSLRVTPVMEAGVADHVWSLEEIVSLMSRALES